MGFHLPGKSHEFEKIVRFFFFTPKTKYIWKRVGPKASVGGGEGCAWSVEKWLVHSANSSSNLLGHSLRGWTLPPLALCEDPPGPFLKPAVSSSGKV